jgi:hypothetical protein
MARGWESKNVEAQQDDATRGRRVGPQPTAAELVRREQRRVLELSRKRTADDLTRATAPAHRSMLEQALAAIDEQLARLH